MKYLYIVFLQQWLWHPELLPLRSLFIMNTLLASSLVPELFCIQTVFHGFLPFTCLEVVIFNNVFMLGRKTGQQLEMQKNTSPNRAEIRTSLHRDLQLVWRVPDLVPWAAEPDTRSPLAGCFPVYHNGSKLGFFSSSILYWVGGCWCKPCRCLSVALVCGNLLFPRYRVGYVDM